MVPVLIGLAALIGGVIIVAYWHEIMDWLSDFIPKLKAFWKELREFLPHQARMFGDLIVEAGDVFVRIMHKLFYKKDNQWYQQTTTRKVDENEVPADIRMKIEAAEEQNKQADVTPEIENELEMTIN